MKKIVGIIAVLSLLAGACGDGDDDSAADKNSSPQATETAAKQGPLTYAVAVDGPSPEGRNISLAAYFPGGLKVHAGDTVVFDNKSTQAPHTISFGIKSDKSNMPAAADPEGRVQPGRLRALHDHRRAHLRPRGLPRATRRPAAALHREGLLELRGAGPGGGAGGDQAGVGQVRRVGPARRLQLRLHPPRPDGRQHHGRVLRGHPRRPRRGRRLGRHSRRRPHRLDRRHPRSGGPRPRHRPRRVGPRSRHRQPLPPRRPRDQGRATR